MQQEHSHPYRFLNKKTNSLANISSNPNAFQHDSSPLPVQPTISMASATKVRKKSKSKTKGKPLHNPNWNSVQTRPQSKKESFSSQCQSIECSLKEYNSKKSLAKSNKKKNLSFSGQPPSIIAPFPSSKAFQNYQHPSTDGSRSKLSKIQSTVQKEKLPFATSGPSLSPMTPHIQSSLGTLMEAVVPSQIQGHIQLNGKHKSTALAVNFPTGTVENIPSNAQRFSSKRSSRDGLLIKQQGSKGPKNFYKRSGTPHQNGNGNDSQRFTEEGRPTQLTSGGKKGRNRLLSDKTPSNLLLMSLLGISPPEEQKLQKSRRSNSGESRSKKSEKRGKGKKDQFGRRMSHKNGPSGSASEFFNEIKKRRGEPEKEDKKISIIFQNFFSDLKKQKEMLKNHQKASGISGQDQKPCSIGSESILNLNRKVDAFTRATHSIIQRSQWDHSGSFSLFLGLMQTMKDIYTQALKQEYMSRLDTTFDLENDSFLYEENLASSPEMKKLQGAMTETPTTISRTQLLNKGLHLKLENIVPENHDTPKKKGKNSEVTNSDWQGKIQELLEENAKLQSELETQKEKEFVFEKLLDYLEKEKGYNLEELLLGLVGENQEEVESEEEMIDINNLLGQDNCNFVTHETGKEEK